MATTLDPLGENAKSMVLKQAVFTDTPKKTLLNAPLKLDDCDAI